MFIYEKRLIDKATGQANDTLNITFEGNKPVENPDITINKDGITGIKSESNAYSFSTEGFPLTISSYSIDGEIVQYSESNYTNLIFTKSVGFNVTNVG